MEGLEESERFLEKWNDTGKPLLAKTRELIRNMNERSSVKSGFA